MILVINYLILYIYLVVKNAIALNEFFNLKMNVLNWMVMKHGFLGVIMLLIFAACSEVEEIESAKDEANKTRSSINDGQYYVQMTLEGRESSGGANEFYFGDEIDVMLKTNIPPSEISCIHYVGGWGTNYNIEDGHSGIIPDFAPNEDGDYSGGEYMYAIKPGYWRVQVWIYTNSSEIGSVGSNVESITINFPEISEDIGWRLSDDLEKIWNKTWKAASESGKYEMGAWIYAYLDDGYLEYEVDMYNIIEGENVAPCAGGSISNSEIQSAVYETIPEFPWGPANSEARFAVAYFHTHTPLTYCESDDVDSRVVGISEGDEKWADAYKIPIFVYDYKAEAQAGGTGRILTGHSLDAEAEYLFYGGVTQRETPQKNYTETLIDLSN